MLSAPRTNPSTEVDELHAAAAETATALDRQFAADHPGANTYVRKVIRHELCVPGESCRWPHSIRVHFLGNGVRMRQELRS